MTQKGKKLANLSSKVALYTLLDVSYLFFCAKFHPCYFAVAYLVSQETAWRVSQPKREMGEGRKDEEQG